ncbi:hypothetical protein DFH27DRAFT_564691 [Peziza echinospora]|nr:hypothetical protein DFH27DRAFT_564691 [Peziza echinospora]
MDSEKAVERVAHAITDVKEATQEAAGKLKREIDQGIASVVSGDAGEERSAKKVKLEEEPKSAASRRDDRDGSGDGERKKGVAPVKAEYLIIRSNGKPTPAVVPDDDAAESNTNHHSSGPTDHRDNNNGGKKKKQGGQNKGRKFQFSHDAIQLCPHLNLSPSTDKPLPCARVGAENERGAKSDGPGANGCKFEHDIKVYLSGGKKADLEGVCPIWGARGECSTGWRCRWLGSHIRTLESGEQELVIDQERKAKYLELIKSRGLGDEAKVVEEGLCEILNETSIADKILLRKSKLPLPLHVPYVEWIDKQTKENEKRSGQKDEDEAENAALYVESRFKKQEKKAIHFRADQAILAPLTTTGNLPFRRLCTSLGASLTYSEMAMSLPLIQGQKSEWALLRAHASEVPNFGAQICAMKPWQAIKATEAITKLIPSRGMSLIDLNCGCPIDLVYRSGGGSALLDNHGKLLKMLNGMAYVSGEIPITCKIRMGTKDASPNAKKLLKKLWDSKAVSAVTLHGRSRQQRYTREADWGYIAECASLIKSFKEETADEIDTAAFKEGFDMAQSTSSGTSGAGMGGRDGSGLYFIGNGDVFSQADFFRHTETAPLDTVMIARGALIKPWVFEEIGSRQYLDKTATERLEYVKDFARYGLETWGADEFGIGTTRRFLLEWLSFTCRYVPLGILEYLPPKIQDRPPSWKGRNELETLMGSHDYRDWIKISEMVLGPTPESFEFKPKHKSNSYDEIEAEG